MCSFKLFPNTQRCSRSMILCVLSGKKRISRILAYKMLRAAGLGLVIFICMMLWLDHTVAGIRMQSSSQVVTAEKPVEQVFQNIKVLKGMPESQLFPTMFFISTSLGRQCNFCHVVKNGELDSAADDKPEKAVARQMMRMVLDIKGKYVQGSTEISCYTCHRGRTLPQGVPILPLSMPSSPTSLASSRDSSPSTQATTSESSSNTTARLTVDDVFAKHLAALGGKSTVEQIRSCTITGTIATSPTRNRPYEIDQVMPEQGYEKDGAIERVINGANGWFKGPDGVLKLQGQQLADQKLAFPLFVILRLREQYVRVRRSGQERIDERETYVVSATRSDQKRELLYFDADTGLLRRRKSFIDTMIGTIPQQTDFENYREVNGVKLPFKIQVSTMDFTNPIITKTFNEIKLNVSVDESKFEPPIAGKAPQLGKYVIYW